MADLSSWVEGRLLGLDCETTGTSVTDDLPVTIALVDVEAAKAQGASRGVRTQHWVLDHGVEIPTAASDIHGWTTERVRAEGQDPAQALGLVNSQMALALSGGATLVAFNAAFDCSIVYHSSVRLDLEPLPALLGGAIEPVVDPLVIDKHLDPFRSGRRRLANMCEQYGVPLADAHDAVADAMATLRLAWKLARSPHVDRHNRMPRCIEAGQCPDGPLAEWDVHELHDAQSRWKREQDESLAAYFRREDAAAARHGDPVPERDWPTGRWPLIPRGDAGVS